MIVDHNIVPGYQYKELLVEKRPLKDSNGRPVEGLYNYWIIFNNPNQFNSYTTAMVKETILAFRQASMDRACVAVVFTAVGDKAFCTGGNTKEYAEYYAGNPQEYKQYMRLFNDMVTHILICDKPVINRCNGARIAGGQEIGTACDLRSRQIPRASAKPAPSTVPRPMAAPPIFCLCLLASTVPLSHACSVNPGRPSKPCALDWSIKLSRCSRKKMALSSATLLSTRRK